MRKELTDRLVKTLGPGLYWDTHRDAPRGFLMQVTQAGSRAFRLNYRRQVDDRERRVTIGDVASYSIEQARKKAAELRRAIDDGHDPLGEAEARREAPTVAELAERYVAEVLPKLAPSTQVENRAMLRDYILPAIGQMKVAAVEREDIKKLHAKVTEAGKPRRANTVKSLCSTLFTYAIEWRMRNANPASGVKMNPEHGRERYLSGEELDRLLAELERYQARVPDSVDAIRLAVLTGARRGEILGMTWAQVDLDGAIWVKPREITKQRKVHRLTLSPEAVAVLQRRQAERDAPGRVVALRRDDHVFRGGGDVAHVGRLERDWREIRAAAGLQDVRFHDLRHTVASWLAAAGLSLPTIGSVLGHTRAATTNRYAHLSDAAQRQAVDVVGRIVGGKRAE